MCMVVHQGGQEHIGFVRMDVRKILENVYMKKKKKHHTCLPNVGFKAMRVFCVVDSNVCGDANEYLLRIFGALFLLDDFIRNAGVSIVDVFFCLGGVATFPR